MTTCDIPDGSIGHLKKLSVKRESKTLQNFEQKGSVFWIPGDSCEQACEYKLIWSCKQLWNAVRVWGSFGKKSADEAPGNFKGVPLPSFLYRRGPGLLQATRDLQTRSSVLSAPASTYAIHVLGHTINLSGEKGDTAWPRTEQGVLSYQATSTQHQATTLDKTVRFWALQVGCRCHSIYGQRTDKVFMLVQYASSKLLSGICATILQVSEGLTC
jgi:hypothetical protein